MRNFRIFPAVYASTSCSLSSFTRKLPSGRTSVTVPSNSSSSSFAIQSFSVASAILRSITARGARALHKSNISQAVWLPFYGLNRRDRASCLVPTMVRPAVLSVAVGVLAVVAVMTVATLLAIAALLPSVMPVAGIVLTRLVGGPVAGTPVGRRNPHADQPLDVAQVRRLFVVAE